jgi:hypothetical protein
MNSINPEKSLLTLLEGREMAAVTFLRVYIQLLFDGPYLNAYTMPQVKLNDTVFHPETPGYRDALCERVGKTVTTTREEPNKKLEIQFSDGTSIEISLKEEDRVCAEAAMLQADGGKRWNVW